MNKLGEKIKKIRLDKGLSQDAFAKELGYQSRSTINKIEKGINEISYDKLMLLVGKYNLEIDELFTKNSKELFDSLNDKSILYISFSGRNNGNCYDIAKYLMNDSDRLVFFKNLFYNPCSKCNYECFESICKYRHDDIYDLLESAISYAKIVFLVPMYCSNPSSLFFILSERMQDYFSHNEDKWRVFIDKLHFVCIYGSTEETPFFVEIFKSFVETDDRILKIERHKYHLSMKDKVIDNEEIVTLLENFKLERLM